MVRMAMLVAWAAFVAQAENNLVYQVFVRSFADSPSDHAPAGAGEIGDLRGIRENLDYLNNRDPETTSDLRAGILWLMPIFPSPSYHGYDVTDFRAVHPDYGTLRDLDDLVRAAHQRGVRMILDVPFNHTSGKHPWFRQALDDPNSRFRKFYHFAPLQTDRPAQFWHDATNTRGERVRYLGLFGPHMPDLNFDEPAVRTEVMEIAQFWLARGIDGFRLDAAKHIYGDTFDEPLPEADIRKNNAWWRQFSGFVHSRRPGALLLGEVLGSRETMRRYAPGLDAELNDSLMNDARTRIAFPAPGFLHRWMETLHACREANARFAMPLFLGSHDSNPRLASWFEQARRRGMRAHVDAAFRSAMQLLMALPRYPVLYQGDELMQRGFKWNGGADGDGSGVYDETLREPFPWRKSGTAAPQTAWFPPRFDQSADGISVEEQNAPGSMLDLVRGLTILRAEHPAYANGEVAAVLTDSEQMLVFEKVLGSERYLALLNTTGEQISYEFHAGRASHYRGAQLIFQSDGNARSWSNQTGQGRRIDRSVTVPAYGFVLLRAVASPRE